MGFKRNCGKNGLLMKNNRAGLLPVKTERGLLRLIAEP